MNHQVVLEALEDLLPEIKQSGSPSDVLLKYAKEQNLSPAQLEKMAQTFNQAKTLTYLDKSANRGGSFSLLDPAELISRYVDEDSFPDEYSLKAASEGGLDKAANTQDNTVHTRFGGPFLLGVATPELDKIAKEEFEKEESERDMLWRHEKEAADMRKQIELAEQVREVAVGDIIKFSREIQWFLREDNELDKETLDLDVCADLGHEEGSRVLKQAYGDADYETTVTKQASADRTFETTTTPDRQKALDMAKALKQAMDIREAAVAYLDDLEKEAATQTREHQSQAGKRRGHTFRQAGGQSLEGIAESSDSVSDYLGKATENFITAPLSRGADAIAGAKRPLDSMEESLGISRQDLLPKKNKTQMKVDDAANEVQSATTLARLMQTDPILSEADPDLVTDMFNTLQETDPEFVRDPARLRMALREAVQYGMIPMHTLKEMTDMRKSKAQATDIEEKARSDKYRIRGN